MLEPVANKMRAELPPRLGRALISAARFGSYRRSPNMAFPAILIGEVAELLARAYVLASSRGRLTTFKPDADVDHKDFIVDKRGGYRHVYIQVKCATKLRQNQVWCVARYLPNQIPTSARVFYLFAFLDLRSIELTRMWLVPARDFNRLAYRRNHGTRVEMWFKTPAEDRRWDRFTVDRKDLGDRVAALIAAAPAEKKIIAPARSLALRLAA